MVCTISFESLDKFSVKADVQDMHNRFQKKKPQRSACPHDPVHDPNFVKRSCEKQAGLYLRDGVRYRFAVV